MTWPDNSHFSGLRARKHIRMAAANVVKLPSPRGNQIARRPGCDFFPLRWQQRPDARAAYKFEVGTVPTPHNCWQQRLVVLGLFECLC